MKGKAWLWSMLAYEVEDVPQTIYQLRQAQEIPLFSSPLRISMILSTSMPTCLAFLLRHEGSFIVDRVDCGSWLLPLLEPDADSCFDRRLTFADEFA